MSVSYQLIISTWPTEQQAQDIGKHLVSESGLVACAQVSGPIHSTYMWQGTLETSREWRLELKTLSHNVHAIIQAIKDTHSYDVPEIIVIPFSDGNPDYLQWLSSTCSTP